MNFAAVVEQYMRRGGDSTGIDFDRIDDWKTVVQEMDKRGTSKAVNIADPFGDGDQRPFTNSREAQIWREMWAEGCNNNVVLKDGSMPSLHTACFLGSAAVVNSLLSEVGSDPKAKTELTERRVGVNRLSALHWAFVGIGLRPRPAGSLHDDGADAFEHVEVVKCLLNHGCNPCARDLCGKTVAFLAIGPMNRGSSSEPFMQALKLCIAAAAAAASPTRLLSQPDRFGATPLTNAVMMDRKDLAKFCIDEKVDSNLKDMDGISPALMCIPGSPMWCIVSPQSRTQMVKANRDICGKCGGDIVEAPLKKCSGCMRINYCSQTCQAEDWKAGHRRICKLLSGKSSEIKADIEKVEGFTITYAFREASKYAGIIGAGGSTPKVSFSWGGKLPKGFELYSFFDIKLQEGGSPRAPILVYDENQKFVVHVDSGEDMCPDFGALHQLIKSFRPCDGRKVYLKACFKAPNVLFISKGPAFACKW